MLSSHFAYAPVVGQQQSCWGAAWLFAHPTRQPHGCRGVNPVPLKVQTHHTAALHGLQQDHQAILAEPIPRQVQGHIRRFLTCSYLRQHGSHQLRHRRGSAILDSPTTQLDVQAGTSPSHPPGCVHPRLLLHFALHLRLLGSMRWLWHGALAGSLRLR